MSDRTLAEAMGMTAAETAELRERAERLRFAHPLSSGLDTADTEPETLAERAEVNQRCNEIRAARAVASMTASSYLIGESRT